MALIKKILYFISTTCLSFFTIIFFQNCSDFYIGEDEKLSTYNDPNNRNDDDSVLTKVNYCHQEDKEAKAITKNMVQISKAQYLNMISDLIADSYMKDPILIKTAIIKLPSQFPIYGFYGYAREPLTTDKSKIFLEVAEELSNIIINDNSILAMCTSKDSMGWSKCVKPIIKHIALNLFRRPLRQTEENEFYNLYKKTYDLANLNIKDISDLPNHKLSKIEAEALKNVITSILLSNSFLYKKEFIDQGFTDDEKNYKIISILSFSLLNSFPDAELFKLAQNKKNLSAIDLSNQIERILNEKPNRFITNFLQYWLSLQNKSIDKDITGNIILEPFLVFKEQLKINQKVEDLLKPGFTFVNSYLSEVYELPSKSTGLDDFVKVQTINRGGLTAQAVSIESESEQTNPIARGIWALSTLLCKELPMLDQATMEEIEDILKTIPSGLTAAEVVEIHREQPKCKTCHQEIDPIGLTLEELDWKGKWRTRYPSGQTVVVDQVIAKTRITKYEDLVDYMNTYQTFGKCIIKKLKSYSYGADPLKIARCQQPNDININQTGIRSLISEVISLGIIENYQN